MSDLTQEQKEEIIGYQNGSFIEYPIAAGATIPNAVETLAAFLMVPGDKHMFWKYAVHGSFESYAAGEKPFVEQSKQFRFDGLDYQAVVWAHWDKISQMLATMKELEGIDLPALVEDFKAAHNIE